MKAFHREDDNEPERREEVKRENIFSAFSSETENWLWSVNVLFLLITHVRGGQDRTAAEFK